MKKIFVAATGQHVGKTTSTLGLVANLRLRGYKTGYCKPVGQKHITVDGMTADKDAVLFSKVIGFQMDPALHSPVILGSGVTAEYIDNPAQFNFREDLARASTALESAYDVVVYEGTGHPGVGSVVDLSNADVASMLDTGVVMVVEGGIGSTIDKLNMSISMFREKQVPIIGVIVNKVIKDKYEKVEFYLEKKLNKMGIPLLGLLPYDPTLSFPIMATVKLAVKGTTLVNGNCLGNKVEEIIPGSLLEGHDFHHVKNALLVVSSRRLNDTIARIKRLEKEYELEQSPLSGVIVTTADGNHSVINDHSILSNPYFQEHEIPVLHTNLDTYGSFVKISRIEVKINTRTPWKSRRAIELIKNHVNFDLLLDRMELKTPV